MSTWNSGCVGKYFKDVKTKLGNEEDPGKRMQGYKCVLNSKATEEVRLLAILVGQFASNKITIEYLVC